MRVFLPSIPLEGRKVIVVGGAEPGSAKARLIARTPAELIWFTPDAEPTAGERPDGVAALARWPTPEELDGAILVFLAIFDAPETLELARQARARGALVNVVDRPELCDFHTPALVDRGEVVIAVATGGAAPILARDLRAQIEQALPPGLEALSGLAREIRDAVKTSIEDPVARRRYWERAFRGRAAGLAAAGDVEGARRELHRLMTDNQPVEGAIWFVKAPLDPEDLTLKAVRRLQNADAVLSDADVPPAVLDLVRRDARRMLANAGDSAGSARRLYDEATAGVRIVRLSTEDLDQERAELLRLGRSPEA